MFAYAFVAFVVVFAPLKLPAFEGTSRKHLNYYGEEGKKERTRLFEESGKYGKCKKNIILGRICK